MYGVAYISRRKVY